VGGVASLTSDLLRRIVYSSFRRAWEEDHQSRASSPTTVYVTEVCQCLLRSWYNRTLKSPPSDNKVVLMVIGDSAHYLMKDYFPLGAGEHHAERDIGGGVRLVGRADRVLEDAVVEFKTVSRAPDKPYDMHVSQVQLYMWLFDKSRAFIAYVSRLNGEVKIFEVGRDDAAISRLLERARSFARCLVSGVVPEAEENPLCAYCEYRELCSRGAAPAPGEGAKQG